MTAAAAADAIAMGALKACRYCRRQLRVHYIGSAAAIPARAAVVSHALLLLLLQAPLLLLPGACGKSRRELRIHVASSAASSAASAPAAMARLPCSRKKIVDSRTPPRLQAGGGKEALRRSRPAAADNASIPGREGRRRRSLSGTVGNPRIQARLPERSRLHRRWPLIGTITEATSSAPVGIGPRIGSGSYGRAGVQAALNLAYLRLHSALDEHRHQPHRRRRDHRGAFEALPLGWPSPAATLALRLLRRRSKPPPTVTSLRFLRSLPQFVFQRPSTLVVRVSHGLLVGRQPTRAAAEVDFDIGFKLDRYRMGSTIDADDGDRAFAGDAQHSAGREVYAAVAADSTAFPNANAAAATGASAAAAKGTPTLPPAAILRLILP